MTYKQKVLAAISNMGEALQASNKELTARTTSLSKPSNLDDGLLIKIADQEQTLKAFKSQPIINLISLGGRDSYSEQEAKELIKGSIRSIQCTIDYMDTDANRFYMSSLEQSALIGHMNAEQTLMGIINSTTSEKQP